MDMVSRARNMIVRPRSEWPVIDVEPASAGALYTGYLVPLGLIGPIASFIGLTLIGISVPFVGTIRYPLINGLTSALIAFVGVLAGCYIWALIINALAPTFSGQKNLVSALKVAIYAATPALLAGILSLIPALGLLQLLAAFYALYLLYLGLPVLMKAPAEKALAYTAVTVVAGIALGIAFGVLMMALRLSPMSASLGGMMPGAMNGSARDTADQAAATNIAAGIIGAAAGGSAESKKAAATIVAGAVAAGKQAAATEKAPAPGAAEGAAAAAAIGSLVSGGKEKVEPVPFAALKALLPTSLGSLKRTDARGEKSAVAGIATSNSEGTYADDNDGRITIKITDMGNVSGIMALGNIALTTESESDSGYEKNVVLTGQKVHEKWTTSGKRSELTSFISDRFMVEVNGSGVDMQTAEKAYSATDVSKLAELKR
ncbi:MAG: hypothetical protein NVSMB64_08880 [Candidatus Velthaea sp.]